MHITRTSLTLSFFNEPGFPTPVQNKDLRLRCGTSKTSRTCWLFKGEPCRGDLSLWRQKCTLMQKLYPAQVQKQTSCEYIGCSGDSLRAGSLGMCCKCWTEAGSGGGGGRQIINYSAPPDKDNHLVSAGQAGKISCLVDSASLVGI